MMHDDDLVLLGYGSLSKFREQPIRRSYTIAGTALNFNDNIAILEVDAETPQQAGRVAGEVLARFVRVFGLLQTRSYTYKVQIVIAETGETFRGPFIKAGAAITSYDIQRLSDDLDATAHDVTITDERFDRAADYYQHALYLFERSSLIADPITTHHAQLISSIFLNLWKAVSVIVGDPSRRGDRYQSRYRAFGIAAELKTRVDRLKELRDDFDVAHYSLDESRREQIAEIFGEASRAAAEVLRAYLEFLRTNSLPPA